MSSPGPPAPATLKERLSRYIARSGVASRRKAEAIIRAGRVSVNDIKTLDPFLHIDPELDRVTVDSVAISHRQNRLTYVALHKPRGYISDLADPRGRPLARDLIKVPGRLYPVGRLDYHSEGLMVFTNDGDFAHMLLHPRHGVEREYLVKVQRPLEGPEVDLLLGGLRIEGILFRLDRLKLIKMTEKNAWYRVVATEGRNRMIRRLAEALGHQVLRLRRVRIGPISLGTLRPGQYRFLTLSEIREVLEGAPMQG